MKLEGDGCLFVAGTGGNIVKLALGISNAFEKEYEGWFDGLKLNAPGWTAAGWEESPHGGRDVEKECGYIVGDGFGINDVNGGMCRSEFGS